MKNVTITNREIAMRAVGAAFALGIGYYIVQNTEFDNATGPGTSSPVAAVSQPASRGPALSIPLNARPYGEVPGCGDVANEIYIGMHESEIACQAGNPEKVNSSTNSYGTHSQYVFIGRDDTRWYVYTNNGFVTSWQESWTK